MTPHDRYTTDAPFRTLVDTLEGVIDHYALTPRDMHDAAMLACIHYERRRLPRPWRLPSDEAAAWRTLLEAEAAYAAAHGQTQELAAVQAGLRVLQEAP